jgi:hypothetical protein
MERVAMKRFGAKEMATSEAVQLVDGVGILGRCITKMELTVDSLGSEYEHDNAFSFTSRQIHGHAEILRRNCVSVFQFLSCLTAPSSNVGRFMRMKLLDDDRSKSSESRKILPCHQSHGQYSIHTCM